MNRTSTTRIAAVTPALVSGAAATSSAQYRAKETFARADTTTGTEFRNDYRNGWNASVPVGWKPASSR